MKQAPDCKRFTGYKPCYPDYNCWENGCCDMKEGGKKIIIINLDGIGDVMMSTAQLPSLKKKYPVSTISWVTMGYCSPLLENNPFLDKVYPYNFETVNILSQLEFDEVINLDKSHKSASLCGIINAKNKLGFGLDINGKIVPLNEGAIYNYNLGMDDYLKFKINKKTKQEYVAETMEIEFPRSEYTFELTADEIEYSDSYCKSLGIEEGEFVLGFNTGCANLYPNKKLTIEQHINLINRFLDHGIKILLLGGPEDTERNKEIYSHFEGKIYNTPSTDGIRRGACYENIADVVITGDSFGMHLAIALKKHVIAWFGLSCWTEIDLYDRGIMLIPEGLECAPCWKKVCPYNLECREMVDLDRIEKEVLRFKSVKFPL
ncbi:MAG: glycosyltransferase family 9 protein [Ignavibacteriaceae bacterium]|nr:glycosyltransferase family 9 protein [Ignavibacteriaceae bacterium]